MGRGTGGRGAVAVVMHEIRGCERLLLVKMGNRGIRWDPRSRELVHLTDALCGWEANARCLQEKAEPEIYAIMSMRTYY